VTLNLPGRHNVLNALAAIAVARSSSLPDAAHAEGAGRASPASAGASRSSATAGRRPAGTFTLVDDYGHHPTEIAATLEGARGAWPGRRVVLAFQPHRYTRTRDCFEDFVKVLSEPEVLVLLRRLSGRRGSRSPGPTAAPWPAPSARAAVEPVFVESPERCVETLRGVLRDGDVLLTQGAGNVGALAASLPRPSPRRPGMDNP
jgi:UDP-N-acetylmuramate--alanine ligase